VTEIRLKSRWRVLLQRGRKPKKRDEKKEAKKFAELSKTNPLLRDAYRIGGLHLEDYKVRIVNILGTLSAGATMSATALSEAIGLPDHHTRPGTRGVLDVVYAYEQDWYLMALRDLENEDIVRVKAKGMQNLLRLTTDEDRTQEKREDEEREARKLREIALGTALGKNPAYDLDGRAFTDGPRVTFAGQALRKLEKLLEREGLVKKSK
jgi:hypothetical protein